MLLTEGLGEVRSRGKTGLMTLLKVEVVQCKVVLVLVVVWGWQVVQLLVFAFQQTRPQVVRVLQEKEARVSKVFSFLQKLEGNIHRACFSSDILDVDGVWRFWFLSTPLHVLELSLHQHT